MAAATWEALEAMAGRAVRHFAAVRGVEAADGYSREMALRHALQCGERELADAVSLLQRLNRKSAGFSLLSLDCRKAYRALGALEFEELASPSDIDAETLVDAISAAAVLAALLLPDVARIRKEVENA
jgi:hypothetical protein